MASLRELFVSLGFKFDSRGAKRAKDKLDGLKDAASKTGQSVGDVGKQVQVVNKLFNFNQLVQGAQAARAALGGITNAFTSVLNEASGIEETDTLLTQVFKNQAESIRQFAKDTASSIGRSEFQLREFAGTIGAIVSPQLQSMGKAGQEATALISKDFSTLAIDLASSFNTSEREALDALRSGITGQSEPLTRFGVTLTEEGISSALGITKKQVRGMSVAEKTMARYRAVMKLTVNAQGDAARTSDGYANSVRAMEAAMRDARGVVGNAILPAFTALVRSTTEAIRATFKYAKSVLIVMTPALVAATGAFILMKKEIIRTGLVSAATAIKTGAVWALANLPLILLIGLLVFIGLLIEDVWVSLTGGKGVFGDLTKSIEEFGAEIYDSLQYLKDMSWTDLWSNAINFIGDQFKTMFSWVGDAAGKVAEFFGFGGEESSQGTTRRRTITPPVPAPPMQNSRQNGTTNVGDTNITVNTQTNARPQDIAREINRAQDQRQRQTRRGVTG